jgi:vesicle-fusing ATPase
MKEKGDLSTLHIIIFDEIDAICKQRGSRNDGTGVGDTVVNQLLSKIDGVNSLNNILVIGMTNRKDLIDDAILRPGRLGVHIEIGLPDENGRLEIFKIHTKDMRDNKLMEEGVNLADFAARTKNYSGSEIEEIVKCASSYALTRELDVMDGIKIKAAGKVMVTRRDFELALEKVKPAFGIDEDEFQNCQRNGIIKFSPRVNKLIYDGEMFVQQVRNSVRTPLICVSMIGQPGSGKTALAAKLATESRFPYVKLISAEMLLGLSEAGRCGKITKVFEDSYKSPLSCIVVDDLERILDYVRIGPRFSNPVLQTLMVLMKKEPPKGRKLLVLSTTSNPLLLEEMGMADCFHATVIVPQISNMEEFKTALRDLSFPSDHLESTCRAFKDPISIKKLIMLLEMAKQGDVEEYAERFIQIISDSTEFRYKS